MELVFLCENSSAIPPHAPTKLGTYYVGPQLCGGDERHSPAKRYCEQFAREMASIMVS